MKIRTDFVTNSSSSSFVIGLKDELTKEKLLKVFNVGEDSIFYPMAREMANFIVREAEEMTLEEVLDDFCEEKISDLPKSCQKIFGKGLRFFKGWASSEGDGIELALYNMDIKYEDENFVFLKEY